MSRNHEARSCHDAAHKRFRLGTVGIPVWDELKSAFVSYRDVEGTTGYALVHCRGDRRVDYDAVGAAVGASSLPQRLDEATLTRFGMAYGLVNPFEPWARSGAAGHARVTQIFDADLLHPIGTPGTVMTNLGDLTWAVELNARELFERLEHTLSASVSILDPDEDPRPAWIVTPRAIGIVTGNAPEAAIIFWQLFVIRLRQRLRGICQGDTSMPNLSVRSVPRLGLAMELPHREAAVWAALEDAVVGLCRTGTEVLALPCDVTPYFAGRIRHACSPHGTRFVSMPDAVGAWLRARRETSVAIVGLSFVADLGPFSAYRESMHGIAVETLGERATERIAELAYHVESHGPDEAGLNRLRDILRQEVRSNTIVLAQAELSVLFNLQGKPSRSGKTIVDPLSIYADAVLDAYLAVDGRDPVLVEPQPDPREAMVVRRLPSMNRPSQ
ncbi:MAG: hypothetical protein ACRD12_11405 [Acidimicrobiales bacterium]